MQSGCVVAVGGSLCGSSSFRYQLARGRHVRSPWRKSRRCPIPVRLRSFGSSLLWLSVSAPDPCSKCRTQSYWSDGWGTPTTSVTSRPHFEPAETGRGCRTGFERAERAGVERMPDRIRASRAGVAARCRGGIEAGRGCGGIRLHDRGHDEGEIGATEADGPGRTQRRWREAVGGVYLFARSLRLNMWGKVLNPAELQSKSSWLAGADRGGVIADRESFCGSGRNLRGHFASVERHVRTESPGATTAVCRSDPYALRIRVRNAGSSVTGVTHGPHQPHLSRYVLHFEPAGRDAGPERSSTGLS